MVLYDRRGAPIRVLNEKNHAFNNFAAFLASCRASEAFLLEQKDLDELTDKGIASFATRNAYERKSLADTAVIDTPLSSIALTRLEKNLFLGAVSISELYARIASNSAPLFAITDTDDTVLGYSLTLAAMLGIRQPVEALFSPLSNLLAFEASDRAQTRGTRRMAFSWKAGCGPQWHFKVFAEKKTMEWDKDGTTGEWRNLSGSEYGYLRLPEPRDVDTTDFDLEIRFKTDPSHGVPGVMARTIFPASPPDLKHLTADSLGYNLSYDTVEKRLIFKRCGSTVHAFPAQGLARPGGHALLFRKTGARFDLALDGISLGHWEEMTPLPRNPGTGLCLFLRPGTSILLLSAEVRSLPAQDAVAEESGARFVVSATGRKPAHLTLSARHYLTHGPRTAVLLEFADTSRLKNALGRLEKEKSELVSLLRPDMGLASLNPAMAAILSETARAAQSGLTVFIEGETGSGKEVLARAIHSAGPRRKRPFVKIDCMAIPEGLMEAELFGHDKGAFTGAVESRPGRFEQADSGTVLLDEIANLSPAVQMKLLNVLQDRLVRRLGGGQDREIDVQIFAASNKPLQRLIAEGRFRTDLYYRLDQIHFRLPPLRERREDIPLLAERFLQEGNALHNRAVARLEPSALLKLDAHPWPGNVRELRNVILRAVLFSKGDVLSEQDIVFSGAMEAETPPRLRRKRFRMKKEEFETALKAENGNLAALSRRLGMGRNSAYRLLNRFNLDPGTFRAWD